MGDATYAIVYAAFAILFCYQNVSSLGVNIEAGVYKTVSTPYSSWPYNGGEGQPVKHAGDIESPSDLRLWMQNVFTEVTFREQVPWPTDSPWNDNSSFKWSSNLTAATVGSFNRILLVRISAKRWEIEDTGRSAFSNFTLKRLAKRRSNLDPAASGGQAEVRSRLCAPGGSGVRSLLANASGGRCYEYRTKGSYADAGGYTFYFDPMNGKKVFQDKLQQLWEDGFFDPQLATFVVDMMVYNANVDRFMHLVWDFSFDFAGNCNKAKEARAFNLNIGESNNSKYLPLNVVRGILAVMIFLFFLTELGKVCEVGLVPHFRKLGSLVDMGSLGLCSVALLSTAYIASDPLMRHFEFAKLFDPATQEATYRALEHMGHSCEEQAYIVGFNLLLVFVRAVVLVAHLQSDAGLILKVMDVSFYNLFYFLTMFLIVFSGFVVMAYFTFGARFEGMSNPGASFFRCFTMMTGQPIYDELERADNLMGPVFYFVFYVFFYLVMINMFLSILLSGYDLVDFQHQANLRKLGKEQGPLGRILEELKSDVFLRAWGVLGGCGRFGQSCLRPFVGVFLDCFSFVPSPKPVLAVLSSLVRRKPRDGDSEAAHPEGTAHDPDSDATSGHNDAGAGKTNSKFYMITECMLMSFFMVVFIIYATLLTRGEESFYVSQSTLMAPNSAGWNESAPARSEGYDDVQSFEGVQKWAATVLGELYADTRCAVVDGLNRTFIQPLSYVGSCSNTNDRQELVQLLSRWNSGFMNSTFVRLTVQPACFVPNPAAKWAAGAPLLRRTPTEQECALTGCLGILSEEYCRTADGMNLSPEDLENRTGATDEGGPVRYNYSAPKTKLGSFNLLGGFVFSLGTSPEACQAMLRHLSQERWFTQNSASMVFDWITYNGNLDLFTYNLVSFSLLGTGEMLKFSRAQTLPLNISEGGGFFKQMRILLLVLFSIYGLLVFFYIFDYVHRMRRDLRRVSFNITKFLQSFFSDFWHISDLLSMVLSIVSIVIFMAFVLQNFRSQFSFSMDAEAKYQVPNDEVKRFAMSKSVEPTRPLEEDWYIFLQFETLEQTWRTCLTVAAFNSFFISIKVVKYAGAVGSVKPFSHTLSDGKARTIYFALVMGLGMVGFSFFFHIVFGRTVPALSTFSGSFITLFDWVVGSYNLTPLFDVHFWVALLFFIAFMVFFYFIAVNMFLATMLNTYSETVGDMDIGKARRAMDRERHVRVVEYASRKDFLSDINMELVQGEKRPEYVVKDPPVPAGPAAKNGVVQGNIIFKVNRDQSYWKKATVEETEDAIQEDKRGTVTVVFRDHSLLTKRKFTMPGLITGVWGEETIKPTVKNFWFMQGAISVAAREATADRRVVANPTRPADAKEGEVRREARVEEEEQGEEEEEDEDEAELAKLGKQGTAAHSSKAERLRTRKRLGALLFSRWVSGRQGGEDGSEVRPGRFWAAAHDTESRETNDAIDCAVLEDTHWDLDELRERIEQMPISGHEAWLDCLVTAMEREMEDESTDLTDLLRTGDMQEMAQAAAKGHAKREQRPLQDFYKNASEVLKILENKAQRKYFQCLQQESEDQQELLRKQNNVIHEYACELEREFVRVTDDIRLQKARKREMLTRLALALDQEEYLTLGQPPAGGALPAAGALGGEGAGAGEDPHAKRQGVPKTLMERLASGDVLAIPHM